MKTSSPIYLLKTPKLVKKDGFGALFEVRCRAKLHLLRNGVEKQEALDIEEISAEDNMTMADEEVRWEWGWQC